MARQVILAQDLGVKLCEALGLSTDNVQEITIRISAEMGHRPPEVMVKMVGDEALTEFDWSMLVDE
jgi:hypothetical protein